MENRTAVRTDLASEAHRLWRSGAGRLDRLPGVEAEEGELDGYPLFRVRILDREGAERLGKPVGRYATLELPSFVPRGDERFPAAVNAAARLIREMLGGRDGPYLLVGLGNRDITPDALGPAAAAQVFPTRHLREAEGGLFLDLAEVSVCTPGVLGSSGLESSLQIRALCRELRPGCVLAVDALAGAEPERLCRTLQVSDSGIAPGSGVGNDRRPLSEETLGVPVLALGVPTVIDAAALGGSAAEGMFVTPRDIDRVIANAGRLIGYAVDLALHPGLSLDEVSALLE